MPIGILGYGKFGKALGGLMEEAGLAYRALDPRAAVPAERCARNLDDLVAGAEFLVLAVPVPALPQVLDAVVPLLAPEQIVFDVGSVKVLPGQWLDERLGTRPHAGTHPLFGPVSLARAERPLRTVLCAAAGQEQAAKRVAGLFQAMGCQILEQTAADHDRVMAGTHALTFFLAKGLLEMGAGNELAFAPPSFHAIQRTLDLVREDASHLFRAIQNENPFAAAARSGLIQALQGIHASLAESEAAEGLPPAVTLPDLGHRSAALLETREQIDQLDQELVALLARRTELSRRAGRAKAALGAPVLDPGRETALLKARRDWAQAAGMDPDLAEGVFQAILRASRSTQVPGGRT